MAYANVADSNKSVSKHASVNPAKTTTKIPRIKRIAPNINAVSNRESFSVSSSIAYSFCRPK